MLGACAHFFKQHYFVVQMGHFSPINHGYSNLQANHSE